MNDLDLVVTAADGVTYLGNDFAGGWSTTGGERDGRNNLEAVHLRTAGPGTYTVTVTAANVFVPASPNVDELAWQDFALVIANAAEATPGAHAACPGRSCARYGPQLEEQRHRGGPGSRSELARR